MWTKSPVDRALLKHQFAFVLVPSREQLAVGLIPNRTQRDGAEHRVQLRQDLVDAMSTKSPAIRALLNGQLVSVPVPSRDQHAVESLPNRTQRDGAWNRALLHQDLVDAVSTKSPANRALLKGQLVAVPVPRSVQLALSRNKIEHNET